jgi:diguanylate cyclase (GGDEF)-like protein
MRGAVASPVTEVRPELRAFGLVGLFATAAALAIALPRLTSASLSELALIPMTGILMALVVRAPLVLSGRPRPAVVILLETATYVVVADLAPPVVAVPAVALGMLITCWTLPMGPGVRVAHFGAATAFWCVVVVARGAVLGPAPTLVTSAGAAILLGLVGEVGGLGIVAVTARASTGRSIGQVLRENLPTVVLAGIAQGGLACFVIIVLRTAPSAMPFLAVPIGMLMVVSRALVRAQKANIRSSGLSEAVSEIQRCRDATSAIATAVKYAGLMLRSDRSECTASAAPEGALAAPIETDSDPGLQLIVLSRGSREPFTSEDEMALAALASTLHGAMRNLELMTAMRWQASHDALTGLPNRALFFEFATIALEERRDRVAIAFVDLDGFKKINDDLGHHAGDTVLQEVARRMAEAVRTSDTVARLGGDEFCLVLRDVREHAEIDRIIAQIRLRLHAPFVIGSKHIILAASIGIAVAPDDGDNIITLLRGADQRMYAAKVEAQTPRARSTGAGTARCSLRQAGSFPKSIGARSSFVPRRCCAGTDRSSRASGRGRIVGPGVPRSIQRSAS